MHDRNQTSLRECRFLNDSEFDSLFEAFNRSFADYVVPFALTEAQLRNHIRLTAVDLNRTAACFQEGRLIGFSMNGFGIWKTKRTVYDACTGVLPECRRQGVSREMFDFMIPILREQGMEHFLLEVITSNEGAIRLYEGLGFQVVRELALLQCDARTESDLDPAAEVEIKEIDEPDWEKFMQFWDGSPSWQNSADAVDRSLRMKKILAAFDGGECVGYILFSARFGRVSQLAVAKEHRGKRIGSALVQAMHSVIEPGFSSQVVNADTSIDGLITFFQKMGFYERLRQHEMSLDLTT